MTATMRAAIYHVAGDIRVEERPLPGDPAAGELLVRIRVCGMCGSDVTTWYMDPRAPTVLGHEPAGDIVAVGAGVTDFKVGDRVALHHHVPCMVCDLCQHGNYTLCPTFRRTRLIPAGMAEYVRIPAEIVARDTLLIPADMSYEIAAMTEPIACCVRALDRSNIHMGDTVVVIGGGFNGVTMALLASHWGADKVALLEKLPARITRAVDLGLKVFNPDDQNFRDQLNAWTDGSGPHAVICTVSAHPAMDMALNLCGPGATLMMYAPSAPGKMYPLDAFKVFFNEITVTGTYSASPFDTRRAMSLLNNGIIDANKLITHRFPLEQADRAWHMTKQAGDSLKVIVEL
ncbi:MAG: alcohol dehydrogenase catalytic domain-containing protein [Anaerolineae bacterium]|nr:alcohol dehydrogenase catalytic domain-containing protein [Anaerolineae bacterium]